MGWGIGLLVLAALPSAAFAAEAAPCVEGVARELAPPDRVLFISAGGIHPEASAARHAQLSAQLSKNEHVIQADLILTGPEAVRHGGGKGVTPEEVASVRDGTPNMSFVRIDNQQEFPFKDNTFREIVMENGVCFCHEDGTTDVSCGGVCMSGAGVEHFFDEVARVLDKTSDQSFAELDGAYGNTPQTMALWQKAADAIMKKRPQVEIRVKFGPNGQIFRGLIFKVRRGPVS